MQKDHKVQTKTHSTMIGVQKRAPVKSDGKHLGRRVKMGRRKEGRTVSGTKVQWYKSAVALIWISCENPLWGALDLRVTKL